MAPTGCDIRYCADVSQLACDAGRFHPDVVIMAFAEEQRSAALTAIDTVHHVDRRLPIVLITSDPAESTVLAALRAGVKDYLREPVDASVLSTSVQRCLASRQARTTPAVSLPKAPDRSALIGGSVEMRAIDDYLQRVAQHDATVLITGETGTGKELAAASIHQRSARRQGRFVSVNCAAIPDTLIESELFGYEPGAFTGASRQREGLLQLANKGTVFLDEVGDLGPQAQAKILRALEAREVYRLGGKRPEKLDVRVVAATNHDLEDSVREGRFRKDLYFRLNVARVHLPPLRERRADIVPLLEHYLRELTHGSRDVDGFAPDVVASLQAYDWPGNVRELKNLVEAVLVWGPVGRVGLAQLPADFRRKLQSVATLEDVERRELLDALLTAKWNKSKAAALLRCSRMTLYRKLTKYSVVTSDDTVSQRRVTPSTRKNAS